MRHYARATAYALQRNRAGFDREIGAMARMRTTVDFKPMIDQGVPATDLLLLAETVARGPLGLCQRPLWRGGAPLSRRRRDRDRIPYMEPPYWYYPVQQSLGAALLRAGKPGEARRRLHRRFGARAQ